MIGECISFYDILENALKTIMWRESDSVGLNCRKINGVKVFGKRVPQGPIVSIR